MQENYMRRTVIPMLQGAAVFLWTLIVKLLTMLTVYAGAASSESIFRDLPNQLIHLFVILAGLLIYNSVLRLIYLFDRGERAEYIELRDEQFRFSREIGAIIRSRSFWLQNATAMPLFAVAAMLGAYPDIGGIILGNGHLNTPLCNIISTVILVPVLFTIGIFTRYEVKRYWIVLEKRQDTERIEKVSSFVWQAIFITVAYPLIIPMAPLLLFAIINIFSILFGLFDALSIIGTVAVVILLVLTIYVIPLLNGMRKRHKFIKQLKAVCQRCGYELSEIQRPYKSFLHPEIGSSFTVSKGDKEYNCAFVSTLHRGTWLSFISDTDAYFRHRIGTKNHHFTINHHIEYGIRGKGRKCIIISPLPKHIFAESDGSVREILPGDRIWDYTVYNMSGFINAIDRNCLDKWSALGD